MPDPDGPTIPSSSPGSIVRSTSRRASTGGSPGIALADPVEFSDRGHDGTTISSPTDRPPFGAVTWTQPSWKMPGVTPTRWVVPLSSTTSTA